MVLGLTLISCPGIAGWVLVSTGQKGVRGHHHLVLVYTWQCVHSHILFSQMDISNAYAWKSNRGESQTAETQEPTPSNLLTLENLNTGHSLTANLISSAQECVGSDSGGAPSLCGWPDPGPFGWTSLPMTASENVWECAVPRPSHQKFNKVTGCVLGKGATSLSSLSHGLGPSPNVW